VDEAVDVVQSLYSDEIINSDIIACSEEIPSDIKIFDK
jgi:hypothetical protein